MIKKLLACATILLFISISYSQRKIAPDASDIAKAKALKEKFDHKDDEIALEESTDYVTFDFDSRNKKVTVNHDLKEKMINMISRADIQKYSFYNDQSTIEEFEILYKNNKSAGFYIKDEASISSDLFHVDSRVKFTNVDFPLQGYRYGTHILKTYKDIKYFTKLYFNDSYPIEKKVISVEIPDWLNLELKELNFEGYTIEKTITPNSKNKSKIYTYTFKDVPAMHKVSNAPGPTYVYPHLLILAKSYTKKGETQPIFNSTQDLYNWYKSLVNSLENDNTDLKSKVTELTKDAKTDEEKIKNIYYWVQDNIRYIAFEDGIAGFKPDEAANVFNKRYGDCKGMANLTKQMLIEAGFDARLTWIGTKHIAYDYSTPNLSVDNHMICTLFKDDDILFLDGTEKFNALGEYADRIQGKQVLIEDNDAFILKHVPTSDVAFNKEFYNYQLTLDNETLTGKVKKEFNGESRSSLLYYFDQLKTDKKDEFLEAYLSSADSNRKVSNITTSDLTNRELNVTISHDLTVKNAVSTFDNSIYIDLDLDKEFSNYELKERDVDFIFSSKKYLESTTELKIPNGYSVTHLPNDIEVSSNNYDLSVSFKNENNTLTYKKLFQIKNAKIETKDFEEWNTFIKDLNTLYQEQIILTKN
ncbi:transglutaminase-like domain-containing protein [Winogradskyella psychrotolerans]|uniref:transglutaminase-like domain-containing protein n=1 Tax=Winogradskyella psychrotolerans TaxID=1344585 RepID=UPI001C072730|nr:transglutaminase-like domain-containing protein [Winogradskyella psychrotolerans]MBU2921401.1 transglutaminase-like domain-containing protein [Winogradskyella psychrotolerans]